MAVKDLGTVCAVSVVVNRRRVFHRAPYIPAHGPAWAGARAIRVEEINNVPILRRIVLRIQGAAKGA